MKVQKKALFLHIAGCILLMFIPVFLFPRPPEEKLFPFSSPTQRDFIANFLMLLVFYLNYYLFIPKLYFKGKQYLYFILIVASYALIVYLPTGLTRGDFMTHNPVGHPGRPGDHQTGHNIWNSSYLQTVGHIIFLYLAVILFSLVLRIRQQYFSTERARQQAELLSLKSQINPHFLFNTLNSIYSLAVTGSDKTSYAVVQLSQHMRYLLEDTKTDFTSVQKEIDHISTYIELQRIRLGDTVSIEYMVSNPPGEKFIAPMLLMQFIENAFKHGVNPDKNSPVRIVLSVTNELLNLSVFNRKVAFNPGNGYGGIGIENTKQRLNLMYPTRHKLVINESETDYTVLLTIQI